MYKQINIFITNGFEQKKNTGILKLPISHFLVVLLFIKEENKKPVCAAREVTKKKSHELFYISNFVKNR